MRKRGLSISFHPHIAVLGVFIFLTLLGCRDQASQKARPAPPIVEPRAALVKTGDDEERKAETEERLQWNIETLVGDYRRVGSRSPKWDEPAQKALELLARYRVYGNISAEGAKLSDQIGALTRQARDAGCDDPLVLYFYARMGAPETLIQIEKADLFYDAADGIDARDYSVIRKFYAHLRASEQGRRSKESRQKVPEVRQHSLRAWELLLELLGDQTVPFEEMTQAIDQLYDSKTLSLRLQHYEDIERRLLKYWSKESWIYQFKGRFFKDFAWRARGNGYASTVKEEGWRLFAERLDIAERAMTHAWDMDPSDARTPREILWIGIGQGWELERFDQWFSRAMKLDTNSYDACSSKLSYLEPKWQGSASQMLAFARECADSKEWGWSVPLILPEAHRRLAGYARATTGEGDYWGNPAVWKEIQPCYEKFFSRYGESVLGWHHDYAWFAYQCRQWEVLSIELKRLGPVNYDYFGGRDRFEKMKREAEQHSTSRK